MQATLKQLLNETLRVVIIESFSADTFSLTVSVDHHNIKVCDEGNMPYLRSSIQAVMRDLSLHDIGEIFIHQKQGLPFLKIPDYFLPTDFGNGVIHLTPTALQSHSDTSRFIRSLNP